MLRPALPTALALALGIALHSRFPLAAAGWIGLGLLLGWLSLLPRRCAWTRDFLLLSAIALAGVAAGQIARHHYPADHVSVFSSDTPRLCQLLLRLVDPPRLIDQPALPRTWPPQQVVHAEVRQVLTRQGWRPATGSVLVQIAQPHARLDQGQIVRATGWLERPYPAMNPGQFNWADYYRNQRLLVSFHVSNAENLVILDQVAPGWVDQLHRKSRIALAAGFSAQAGVDHALLRALLLGDTDPELREIQDQFRATGTSHHLAISGMHVAVLGGVVFLCGQTARLRPRVVLLVALGFTALYGLAALPGAPVTRAVLMAVCFAGASLLDRRADPLQLLALAASLMLLAHPLDLFNPGFQLSFGTVFALALFTRLLVDRLSGQNDPAMRLNNALRRGGWLRQSGQWLDRQLLLALAAGIVAWIASMPLIASHFEQLSPYAILFSILLAPVVFLALVSGLLKVLLTLALPSLANLWADMFVTPTRWMRQSVELMAQLPGGDIPLPAPPPWLILAFYLAWLATLAGGFQPGLRWVVRGSALLASILMVVLPFQSQSVASTPLLPGSTVQPLELTVLAVGAGQCVAVETPAGRVLLIDAGSSSSTDLVRRCLGPFLRRRGHTQIEAILLSHPNFDHFSAAAEAAEVYNAREVLVSPLFAPAAVGNAPAEALLETLEALDRPPRPTQAGQIIPWGRETSIRVLWPTPGAAGLPSNDQSLVVRLEHAGRSVLLAGDLEEAGLQALLAGDRAALKSDVLIAPHHGSLEPSTARFLEAVDPDTVIASNDRSLTRKQRDFDRLAHSQGRTLYRTHLHGAITVRLSRQGIETQAFLSKS